MRRLACLVFVVAMALAIPVVAADSSEDVTTAPSGPATPPSGGTVWAGPRALLYDNGPVVTSAGTGVGGADESILENLTLGMTTLGLAHQFTSPASMADDFTIPVGETWQIDAITTFAYQSFAGSPSTISGVYMRIYDGPPDAGGTVVWGDSVAGGFVSNLMSSTSWTNIYRVSETSTGTSADRAVMASVAAINTLLTEGTYWVEWSVDGSASFSGPWAPPVTIPGQATTGNALQYFGGLWQAALDGGTGTQLGMPFIIDGTLQGGGGGGGTGAAAEPIPTLSNSGIVVLVLALIGIAAVLIRRRI